MFKKLLLSSMVSVVALSAAEASHYSGDDNNNSNNAPQPNFAVRVVHHAKPQKQACISAALQLNLDRKASKTVFAKAEEIQRRLPNGIDADFGTNTPHVTLETFEPVAGGNLSDAQLVDLRGRLESTAKNIVRNGPNGVEIVPVELKLIAKFEGQANRYYTKANIDELNTHEGNLTECYLTYDCNVRQGNQVKNGTEFLKDLQTVLHGGLRNVTMKHGPFAANPLCHVTLMKWKITQEKATVVDFCKTLFSGKDGVFKECFAVDKLALNPMFAGNSDEGKTPYFAVNKKMQTRNTVDWAQEPRAYESMLDLKGQVTEKEDEVKDKTAQISTHESFMKKTQENVDKYTAAVDKTEQELNKHKVAMGYTENSIKNKRREMEQKLGMTLEKKLEQQKKQLDQLQTKLDSDNKQLLCFQNMQINQQSDLDRMQAQLKTLEGEYKAVQAKLAAQPSQSEAVKKETTVINNNNNNNNVPVPTKPDEPLYLIVCDDNGSQIILEKNDDGTYRDVTPYDGDDGYSDLEEDRANYF